MTIGKMQATASGKMLAFASGKLMAECCCAIPEIDLSGTLDFYGVECDLDTDTNDATVENIGAAKSVLTWARSLSMDAGLVGFLTALPANGVLSGGDSDTIVVSLAKSGITAGTYTGTLKVSEQLISGVDPAELPITVQIDTYASFPALMSLHGISYPPAQFWDYKNARKVQDATRCVGYSQVCARLRSDGQWYIDFSGYHGPVEMWYNPDYGFESKYIYSWVTAGATIRAFACESAVSPWTMPYPGTWNRDLVPPPTVPIT